MGTRIRGEQRTRINGPQGYPLQSQTEKLNWKVDGQKKLGPSWVQNSGQLAPFSTLSGGRATESTMIYGAGDGIEPITNRCTVIETNEKTCGTVGGNSGAQVNQWRKSPVTSTGTYVAAGLLHCKLATPERQDLPADGTSAHHQD